MERRIREESPPREATPAPAAGPGTYEPARQPLVRAARQPSPPVTPVVAGAPLASASPLDAGVPLQWVASMKQAAMTEAREKHLELGKVREMLTAIPWGGIDAPALKLLFGARILEEIDLVPIYSAMLAELTRAEGTGR